MWDLMVWLLRKRAAAMSLLTTLVAAAAAGFLIWFGPPLNRWTMGRYWDVIGLMVRAAG